MLAIVIFGVFFRRVDAEVHCQRERHQQHEQTYNVHTSE